METGDRFVLRNGGDKVEDRISDADGEPGEDDPLALDKNLAKVGRRDNRMICDWCRAAAYSLLWSLGELPSLASLCAPYDRPKLRPSASSLRGAQENLQNSAKSKGSRGVHL